MMDPKIRTLLMLEELSSYTKTAQALNLTQPAVSNHIKLLEQEYGIQIFVRGKRKLKATAEGAILLKYAHQVAALSAKARQSLQDASRGVNSLTVGITPTAGDLLAPQVIAAYLNAHPQIHIRVVRNTIKKIDNMMQFYELDFAIVDGTLPGERYSSVLLGTDYLCLIVSPQHPFAHRTGVTLDELAREKLVLRPKEAGTRKLFEGYLISHGRSIREFEIMMEIDSVSSIKEIVAGNLGVSIISHSVCREEEKAGRLKIIPIENCMMVRQLSLVFPHDFAHPEILKELQEEYHRRVK